MNILEGKRTYITGLLMVVYAAIGLILGNLDQTQAIQIGGTGAGLIFLRKAL